MQHDARHGEGPVVLASAPVGGAVQPDASLTIPRLGRSGARLSVPLPRSALTPAAGRVALAALLCGALAVVAFSTAAPSVLVPRSATSFPHWMSGPLHGLLGHLDNDPMALSIGFSSVLIVMGLAYLVVLSAARTLSMRAIAACVVALHLVLLLGPPLPLTDLFNYLGYARLGALHHLNPYTHVIAQAAHDPVFAFTTWHHLHSPYGPAFTAATYPLAFLPIPVAYWVLKVITMLGSLAVIALVWQCARQLGRDPRFAVLFLAANPIVLIYGLGGFHNDVFMLIPALGAISLLLARRDRTAGAVLMLAVAIKFTAILLLPFLLIAARPAERRLRVLAGTAIAAVPLILGTLLVFGFSMPNLSDQSTLLTDFSVPNVIGLMLGVGGGTTALLRVANVLLVLVVLWQLRRGRDWLSGAGWSTLALIASLAWLVPWYVIWLLPLAALGTSVQLRRWTLALSAYLVLAFMPATGIALSHLGWDPMGSAVGQASKSRQHLLEQ